MHEYSWFLKSESPPAKPDGNSCSVFPSECVPHLRATLVMKVVLERLLVRQSVTLVKNLHRYSFVTIIHY